MKQIQLYCSIFLRIAISIENLSLLIFLSVQILFLKILSMFTTTFINEGNVHNLAIIIEFFF
jgi:hypothetical protein